MDHKYGTNGGGQAGNAGAVSSAGGGGKVAASGGAHASGGGGTGAGAGRTSTAGTSGGGQISGEAGMGGDSPIDTLGGMGGAGPGGCGGLQCAAEAKCVGTGVDAVCQCGTGYSDPRGNGTLCQDVDECANLNGGCNSLVTCVNTPGSFMCGGCPTGYTTGSGTACVDINECATNNGGCDKAVTCTNTPGARTCGNCPFGYSGTGDTACTDINECTTNNGGCDKTVTCVNTPGSHTCGDCPAGYSGGGASGCVDINECATNNGGCDSHVTCTNAAGSFSCGSCPAGYTGTGATGCVDVNECATSNGGCDGNATCTNTAGSRTCACKTGYTGDGATCADVNECLTSNGGCNANATCTNTTGSRSCACNTGYTGDGTTCADVNECLTNNGGCSANAICTNTTGSRNCACKTGYAGDGVTCTAPGTGCRWNCTGTNCVQVALDQDSDGHGTTACVAAPGDDCDDTNNAIYPGATELCDGIDNNCNKKTDLSDGLPLVGATQTLDLPRTNLSLAAAGDGSFGMIGTSPTDAGVFFGTISSSGSPSFSGTLFPPSSSDAWLGTRLAWANGDGNYGVIYNKDGRGGLGSYAGVMAFTSCCWVDVNPPGSRADITARGQGDLLMVGISSTGVNLATQSRSGNNLTGNLPVTGSFDSYSPRAAAVGNNAAVIWQTASPKALNWSLISPLLQFGTTESLSTSAGYPDISAITAGYGLAWVEGVGFRFMIKKTTGATQCTSSVVPFGSVPSNQQLAVGDSANGTVVVATSPDSNIIHLYRFDNACKLVDDIDVNPGANAPTEPRVVRGGSHVVVYWREGASTGRFRFLSDMLCH